MIVVQGASFPVVLDELKNAFLTRSTTVDQERWQGKVVKGNPAARTHELRNVVFEVPLKGIEDLDHWRQQIGPNLPWADDHFAERVGGDPLNPGKEWRNWPWAASADKFRDEVELFNHTYAERLWPKWPRLGNGGTFEERTDLRGMPAEAIMSLRGINWSYGDLSDLVDLLAHEPTTRQAWIPLFFPEDTGTGDGGRKPCTLGYNFLCRRGQLHVWYPLRSCDFVRHFPDDCYLAVRLLLWVLDRCREIDPDVWDSVVPGTYAMHCTSLHVFANDLIQMRNAA